MAIPICNQADIFNSDPRICREKPRRFDKKGYERTQQRTGACECPKCGLLWPVIEEPNCWTQDKNDRSKWIATEWFGSAYCEQCAVVMVDQPDGDGEYFVLMQPAN